MKTALLQIALAVAVMASPMAGVGARAAASSEPFQNKIASCTVRAAVSQSRAFVIGAGPAPRIDACLGREWQQASFRVSTFRYALAKVLLQRDYPEGLPENIATASVAMSTSAVSRDRAEAAAEQQRMSVADCAIRKAPSASFALAGVDAGEEVARPIIEQFAPVLAACSEGTEVRYLTGFEMHQSVVTRMYQLAYAARKPSNA